MMYAIPLNIDGEAIRLGKFIRTSDEFGKMGENHRTRTLILSSYFLAWKTPQR